MKGLVKLAWICAILSMGAFCTTPACAGAPRDAIRKLPSIETRVRWASQNDDAEQFQAHWDVNWDSGNIKVDGFQSRLNFNYRLDLQDNQNTEGNFTHNTRGDGYSFRIDLLKQGYLTAYYQFQHDENSSNRFPASNNRVLDMTDIRTAYLELAPKDAPRFTMTTQQFSNVNQNGFSFNRGTDSMYWKGFAEHRGNTERGGYQVQFHNESRLSRERGSGGQSTSQGKYQLMGSRDLQIGNMGRLQMQLNYLEDSNRNDSQEAESTQTDLNYLLSFGGGLPDYPVRYDYFFKARHWGNLANAGNRSMERQLQLAFNPPMSAGRSLSVVYVNNAQDFVNQNNSTAISRQNLNIGFNPNQRTQAQLLFGLQNDFNNITEEMTQEVANLEGKLNYNIPGGRGSYFVGMKQQQNIGRNRLDRRASSSYTYRASSVMGRQANVSMEVTQAYDDNYNSASLISTPTDNLQTRVVYNFSGQMPGAAGGGISLTAEWERNLLRREISYQKNDNQILRLNFAYNAAANWTYRLSLQASDGWSYNGSGEFTDRFANSDSIEAQVSHRF
jgi:hypothetical protein